MEVNTESVMKTFLIKYCRNKMNDLLQECYWEVGIEDVNYS